MKLSWMLLILLVVFVAIFSVQNAAPITVRFLAWDASISAALVIQLAALLGGLVGLTAGAWSRRGRLKSAQADAGVAGSLRPGQSSKGSGDSRSNQS